MLKDFSGATNVCTAACRQLPTSCDVIFTTLQIALATYSVRVAALVLSVVINTRNYEESYCRYKWVLISTFIC